MKFIACLVTYIAGLEIVDDLKVRLHKHPRCRLVNLYLLHEQITNNHNV